MSANVREYKQTPSFWNTPTVYSTKFIVMVWVGLLLLIEIPSTLSSVSAASEDLDGRVCEELLQFQVGGAISGVLVIIPLIVVGIKLRKVHDAFFLKTELKILIVLSIIMMGAVGMSSKTVFGPLLALVVTIGITTVSFLVPCIMALKNSMTPSGKSDSLEESSKEVIGDVEEEVTVFTNHTRIARKMRDPEHMKFVEEYLLHYQDTKMSIFLLFWAELVKYKGIPEEISRTCKAWLIYQKYISDQAYLPVPGLNEQQGLKLNQILTAAMDEDEKKEKPAVGKELFDDMRLQVEDELAEGLFPKYFRSDFYRKYEESKSLTTGIGQNAV